MWGELPANEDPYQYGPFLIKARKDALCRYTKQIEVIVNDLLMS